MHSFIISGFSDEINENIEIQFETLQRLGMKYFEPRGINGKNIADLTDDEVFKLLTAMKKYGIRASSIASPIGKIGIRDDFESHFKKFKRVIEIAKALGTEYIRIFSFYIPEGDDPNKYRGEVTFRLVKMITYAKSQNIVLLHENEKGTYGDNLDRCLKLFDALYSSNFKAVFNPANFVQCGDNAKESFEKLYLYIAYMRIKDTKYNGNVGLSDLIEGNIEYILKKLKEKNFFGFLSFEPLKNNTNNDADSFIFTYNSLVSILEKIQ